MWLIGPTFLLPIPSFPTEGPLKLRLPTVVLNPPQCPYNEAAFPCTPEKKGWSLLTPLLHLSSLKCKKIPLSLVVFLSRLVFRINFFLRRGDDTRFIPFPKMVCRRRASPWWTSTPRSRSDWETKSTARGFSESRGHPTPAGSGRGARFFSLCSVDPITIVFLWIIFSKARRGLDKEAQVTGLVKKRPGAALSRIPSLFTQGSRSSTMLTVRWSATRDAECATAYFVVFLFFGGQFAA